MHWSITVEQCIVEDPDTTSDGEQAYQATYCSSRGWSTSAAASKSVIGSVAMPISPSTVDRPTSVRSAEPAPAPSANSPTSVLDPPSCLLFFHSRRRR